MVGAGLKSSASSSARLFFLGIAAACATRGAPILQPGKAGVGFLQADHPSSGVPSAVSLGAGKPANQCQRLSMRTQYAAAACMQLEGACLAWQNEHVPEPPPAPIGIAPITPLCPWRREASQQGQAVRAACTFAMAPSTEAEPEPQGPVNVLPDSQQQPGAAASALPQQVPPGSTAAAAPATKPPPAEAGLPMVGTACVQALRQQTQLATLLLERGRHDDALAALQPLLAQQPEDAGLLCLQGRCLALAGSRPQVRRLQLARMLGLPAC